jgi:hypothetical protein
MPDPVCTACNMPRKAIASEPMTHWYQITFYKCLTCNSVLRLVERRQRKVKEFGKRRRDRGKSVD